MSLISLLKQRRHEASFILYNIDIVVVLLMARQFFKKVASHFVNVAKEQKACIVHG